MDQQNGEFSELRLQLDTSKVECHTAVSRVSELEYKLNQTLTIQHDQQAAESDLLRERDRNDALVKQIAEAAIHIELHEMNIAQMVSKFTLNLWLFFFDGKCLIYIHVYADFSDCTNRKRGCSFICGKNKERRISPFQDGIIPDVQVMGFR